MWSSSIFSRSIWSPSIWRRANGASGASLPPRTLFRDRDAYDAIVRLLAATGAFNLVAFGSSANRDRAGADVARVASVQTTGRFKMEGDGSPDRTRRTVEWQLTIKVQATTPDPQDAYAALDLLAAIAHNTLENKSYGGFTIAWLSTLGGGRIVDTQFPELRYSATGTFAYIVDDSAGGLSVAI